MTSFVEILKTNGPTMSSELAKLMEKLQDVPYNTASQRLVRTKDVRKISGFFQSNQSLCYLPSHAEDGQLYVALEKALFSHGRKYWFCLNALNLHGGIISQKFLQCYTNYPIIELKQHQPFETVMRRFVSEGILIFNGNDYLFSPKFHDAHINSLAHKTLEIIKENVLDNFHSLTRNIGIISYGSGETFAEFGKFRWGFKGLSPVIGLKQAGRFGYVLADILLGKATYEKDIQFFIEKIKHVQSFKNASRLLPFLLVDDMDKSALLALKKHGIIVGIIKELFGEKYGETLKELISILNNAGASLKSNPEKYLELLKELKKYNEGLANNIRGTLFEYVVGHIHSVNCQSIDLGTDIIENKGRHEIDVLAIYDGKIVIAECKGTMSPIRLEVVEKWLEVKIPAFKKWFSNQETWKKKSLEFEFWATSGFEEDALQSLKDASSSIKKYKLSFYGPKELRQRAKEMNNKKLKEALDNFFIKPKV